jgi:hypothetical protein
VYDRWPQTAEALLAAGYRWDQALWACGLIGCDPDGNLVNLFTPVTEEAIKKFNG